jgi:hypothetical protein
MNILFKRNVKKALLKQSSYAPNYWDGIAEKLNINEVSAKNQHSKKHYRLGTARYAISCVLAVSIVCAAAFGSTLYDTITRQNKPGSHTKNSLVSKTLHRLDFVVCAAEPSKSNSAPGADTNSPDTANPGEKTNITNIKENKLTPISLGTMIQKSKLSARFIVCCDGEIDTLTLKSDKGVFYKGREPQTAEEVKIVKLVQSEIGKMSKDFPFKPSNSIEAKYEFNVDNVITKDANGHYGITIVEDNLIVEPGDNTLVKHVNGGKDTSFWWETTPDIFTCEGDASAPNGNYKLDGPVNITATVKFKDGQELTKTLVLSLSAGSYGVLEATVK